MYSCRVGFSFVCFCFLPGWPFLSGSPGYKLFRSVPFWQSLGTDIQADNRASIKHQQQVWSQDKKERILEARHIFHRGDNRHGGVRREKRGQRRSTRERLGVGRSRRPEGTGKEKSRKIFLHPSLPAESRPCRSWPNVYVRMCSGHTRMRDGLLRKQQWFLLNLLPRAAEKGMLWLGNSQLSWASVCPSEHIIARKALWLSHKAEDSWFQCSSRSDRPSRPSHKDAETKDTRILWWRSR